MYNVFARPDVYFVRAYVAEDLSNLRFAYVDDFLFAAAIQATSRELGRALALPTSYGKELEHDLKGWRRASYAALAGMHPDLRIVFQAHTGTGIDVLMFGPRRLPDTTSVYHIAGKRIVRR